MTTDDYAPRITPPPADAVERVAALWGGEYPYARALLHDGKSGAEHGGAQFCVLDGKVKSLAYSLDGIRGWVHVEAIPGMRYWFLSPTGGVLPWSVVDGVPEAPAPVLPAAAPEPPLSAHGVGLYRISTDVQARVEQLVLATGPDDARREHDGDAALDAVTMHNSEVTLDAVSRVSVEEVRSVRYGHPAQDNPEVWITAAASEALGDTPLDDVDPHLDDVEPYLRGAP